MSYGTVFIRANLIFVVEAKSKTCYALYLRKHIFGPLSFICAYIQKLTDDQLESDVDEGSHSLSSSLNTFLPVASEVHISIINSPNYSPRMNYTEALKKYFQVARFVEFIMFDLFRPWLVIFFIFCIQL